MAAEDRGPAVVAVVGIMLGLSWITVSLRCYVRGVMIKSFGLDDWLAVATLVRTSHALPPTWELTLIHLSDHDYPIMRLRPTMC
jgi:hypothetical protein